MPDPQGRILGDRAEQIISWHPTETRSGGHLVVLLADF